MTENSNESPPGARTSLWTAPTLTGGVLSCLLVSSCSIRYARVLAWSLLAAVQPCTFYAFILGGALLVVLAILRPRVALWLTAALLPIGLAGGAALNLRAFREINEGNIFRIERRSDRTMYGLMRSCQDPIIPEVHAIYQYLRLHWRGRPLAVCCRDKISAAYLTEISQVKILPQLGPHDLKEEELQRIKDRPMVEFHDGEGDRLLVPEHLEASREGETILMRRCGRDHYFLPASWLDLNKIPGPR